MKKNLKKTIALSAAVLALAVAAPAFAQYDTNPSRYANNEGGGFPTNYPWFDNSVPQSDSFRQYLQNNPTYQEELEENPGQLYDQNYRNQRPQLQNFLRSNLPLWRGLQSQSYGLYDDSFGSFLASHPRIAAELRSNPDLIYNRNYLSGHTELSYFLSTHPNVWRSARRAGYVSRRNPNHWGAYDTNRQWRDAYWWHENQPDEFYQDHSEWASLDPQWAIQDGAYDNQHRWHYGKWWYQQNPNWVSSNHPNWLQQHRYWATSERMERNNDNLNYRRERQFAEREENIRNRQIQTRIYDQNNRQRRDTRQLAVREQRNRVAMQHQAMREQTFDRKVERNNEHRERVASREQNHQAAHVERQQNREVRHAAHEQNKQARHDNKQQKHNKN